MRHFGKLTIVLVILMVTSSVYAADDQALKQGNIVHITVLGYPELSETVVIRSDGTTDYPLLADIPIDGMTILQLQEVLYPLLARYVQRPKIFITVEDKLHLEVKVQGQVLHPGTHQVLGPIGLQGVIAIAGGPTQKADLKSVTIFRYELGKQVELNVDLIGYLTNPDMVELPDIKSGDIIFLPMLTSSSLVRVAGFVRNPGMYEHYKAETIYDIINLAGGLEVNGALTRVIHISQGQQGWIKNEINIKKLLNKGLTNEIPMVSAGDVIIIPEKKWYQNRIIWVQALRDVALILSSIAIISRL